VYIELYSNKLTLKQLTVEDFTSSLINLSQTDNSTKKIINLIAKQATNPTFDSTFTVSSVSAKDFLFGRLFSVQLLQGDAAFSALVYHDHASEQAQLLSWGPSGATSNCLTMNGLQCQTCVEGYSLINGICVFGCGVLCKTVQI
jgi:hypothetical protein